jgi:hypothetical protein
MLSLALFSPNVQLGLSVAALTLAVASLVVSIISLRRRF